MGSHAKVCARKIIRLIKEREEAATAALNFERGPERERAAYFDDKNLGWARLRNPDPPHGCKGRFAGEVLFENFSTPDGRAVASGYAKIACGHSIAKREFLNAQRRGAQRPCGRFAPGARGGRASRRQKGRSLVAKL